MSSRYISSLLFARHCGMQAQYNIFIGGVFQKEAAKLFPTAPYSARTKEEGNA
jgi:hypothetical protein